MPNGTAEQSHTNGATVTVAQALPNGHIPPTTATKAPYTFLHTKLKHRISDGSKTPLVLVACGSFSPISVLHLQMFEMAENYAHKHTSFEVVGSYLSPVSDAYGKSSLVPANHRLLMCNLAVENAGNIMVDSWEALRYDEAGKPVYTPTLDVLRHFDDEINGALGGIQTPDGSYKRAQVVLLMGADVAVTMGDPKIWEPADIDAILGVYGAFIVERSAQVNIDQVMEGLKKYKKMIWYVNSFENDVSSTKIRNQIRNGENTADLPDKVVEYIKTHELYTGAPAVKAN